MKIRNIRVKKKESKRLGEIKIKMKVKKFIVYLKAVIYNNLNKIIVKTKQIMTTTINKRKIKKELKCKKIEGINKINIKIVIQVNIILKVMIATKNHK